MQTKQIYAFIHGHTNQKNISTELHRTFNSYLGMLYAASTPAVNIDVATVFLYSDLAEAKPNHLLNRVSFEVMMQYFDSDFFNIWAKHYKKKKNYDPESIVISHLKAKLIELGPTLK